MHKIKNSIKVNHFGIRQLGHFALTYKADGTLNDMTLDNGKVYSYEINSTGDVTGLKDGNGNEVVTYSYNATGKVLNITESLASTVSVSRR